MAWRGYSGSKRRSEPDPEPPSRRSGRAGAAALLALLVLAGAPGDARPESAGFLGLAGPVPDTWVREPPATSMRLLQYRIPGAPGDARLVVFYFGRTQGGSPEANIARWASQFTRADGGPVTPRISRGEASSMPFTLAEFQGTYSRGVGTGPVGTPLPDHALLAVVLETSRGRAFIQLWGPREAVEQNRDVFLAFVNGLH